MCGGNEAVLEFKQYRRTQIAEMVPWVDGFDMTNVSVSRPDALAGSPKPGDMIARNPKNHDDKWLVAAQYFADNFEELTEADGDEMDDFIRAVLADNNPRSDEPYATVAKWIRHLNK